MSNTVEPQSAVRAKSQFREILEAVVVALLLAAVVRVFVVQAYKIPSRSMVPTLLVGDHILVNKFIYGIKIPGTDYRLPGLRAPRRGDVVVFVPPDDPNRDFIKRIVGVPGDTIEVRAKKVYVNGKPSDQEAHAIHVDERPVEEPGDRIMTAVRDCEFPRPGSDVFRDWFGPCTVPPEHYFMMGDNRDQSQDSRFWGYVPMKDIRGKAFVIYWSWDWEDRGPIWQRVRWGRLGDGIP
ncbi:MAG TPA: signal peptidase I [Thermodesulfobacteriota bacterium]